MFSLFQKIKYICYFAKKAKIDANCMDFHFLNGAFLTRLPRDCCQGQSTESMTATKHRHLQIRNAKEKVWFEKKKQNR
jgi:hypothetical protein